MGRVDTLFFVWICIVFVVVKAIENKLDWERNSEVSFNLSDFTAHDEVIMTGKIRPKVRISAFVLESQSESFLMQSEICWRLISTGYCNLIVRTVEARIPCKILCLL